MATGTNTVALFLKKRDAKHAFNADLVADDFILHNNARPNDFADTKSILAAYAQTLGFALDDFKTFLGRKPNAAIVESDWYGDYRRWFEDLTTIKNLRADRNFKKKTTDEQNQIIEEKFFSAVLPKEKDKFECFMLAFGQQTLIVRTHADGKDEKRFLGYDFSKRRGDEGNLDNEEKLNFIVRQMLLGEMYNYTSSTRSLPNLPTTLGEQARIVNLLDCFDFSRVEFEKAINLSATSQKKVIESQYESAKLEDFAIITAGQSPESSYYNEDDNGLPFYQGKIEFGEFYLQPPRIWTTKTTKESYLNDILVSVRAPVGEVNFNGFEKICIGRGLAAIKIDSQKALTKYVFYLFRFNKDLFVGNQGAIFDSISKEQLSTIKIPLPPLIIQHKIVDEIEAIEKAEAADRQAVDEAKDSILNLVTSSLHNVAKVRFDSTATLEYGSALPEEKRIDGQYAVMGSNGIVGYHNEFLIDAPAIVVGRKGSAGKINYVESPCYPIDTTFWVSLNKDKFSYNFFYYLLRTLGLEEIARGKGVGVPGLNRHEVHALQIPSPLPDEQEHLVAKIEVLEAQIAEAEARLAQVAEQKAAVLRKYL